MWQAGDRLVNLTAPTRRSASFRFRPLGLRDALAASRWRYPGDYAMYDLALVPLLVATLLRGPLAALADVAYYAVARDRDPLIGVFSLTHRGDDVEIGVGLRPDLNGHGLGLPYLLEGLDLARERYHPQTFSLHVATFNQRAINVYTRAGFLPGPLRPFTFRGQRYAEMRMNRLAL
ncbi:MAG TPA: GNAT family protein [Ktedonobacterales bacterium]|nr:GNAT family protein [Ktedonobacterales bacterium]